ncbi:bifunctional phosphoribosyl-AMP cyclohydrolase/phosphoribosyl-ATP diphosphatase HisIE [Candidatus Ishikawella capsulata]|uniref:Histidine biosynthesis bifunctional protein HisIE n=1 Tax=Candidatus Ishikawaella capsulata Mpkobe TaxID=476281 RepID=C5WDB4_9ENTR|nr:bifunctional phosphoribosyl-AMP cyclohydrolase/phosphoribosyl-ATP diphosphatase HisIE [Candidatus Ishikawaella capsulata]BAH83320.1 bifunctional phosphoribosyl-AMP cyclohydrolase/phosphoribosyl-ATP pyrophosphatase protein [Candidatus Ishikawaella capsulata Mpkobe]
MLSEKILSKLNWVKTHGRIPVIIQHNSSGQVLMHGYMDQDALQKTLADHKVTFFSRTKNRLWTKGESSGCYLKTKSIIPDCDNDALLILVDPISPTCHLGNDSCFLDNYQSSWAFLWFLEKLIASRKNSSSCDNSYTAKLYTQGIKRIAQKVGEEGLETALAAVTNNRNELINEVSDLIYHLLVLLQIHDLDLNAIINNLKMRHYQR